ncbi:MAG: VanZ family protein [Blastococcus sp.]|jgi:glycopeptide antibiotics resistance protein|nr:VanZ family protein [Blastococcus sp.]
MPSRRVLDRGPAAALAALVALVALVALATLWPTGRGWTWGAPVPELRWYATAWTSGTAMIQLLGNLALLGPLAAFAVLRWPALGSPRRLATAALAAGTSIELLQWALPLGRVVSPVDALLNATGAVVTGLVVLGLRDRVGPVATAR